MAFSRFAEIPFTILCGSTRMSLFSFSYFARRSNASGGVFPVIIRYIVAANAYTSVCGPWSLLLRYCSSGEYPGLMMTVRLRLCEVVAYREAPKSISFTSPVFVRKMLSGAISRCSSPSACTTCSDFITGVSICTATSSGTVFSRFR